MRILIADDDRICTRVLGAALQQWGHEVICANDGGTAWDLMTKLSPPMAIVDWMMPTVDGTELCQRIRQHPALAQMYVMLLSARESRADMVAGLDAGADDYLTKPFDREELRARVQVGIRLIEANAETGRLLASISSILIGMDARGCITRWNSAAQDTFGIASAEAIGRPLLACGINWGDPDAVAAALDRPKISTHLDDLRFKDVGGGDRVLSLTVMTMQRGSEGADGFVVLGSEVTERRVLEDHLRQAQKLEGIGQLAAGIAHEINTPMQYIGDNLRFVGDSINTLDGLFTAVLDLCAQSAAGKPPSDLVGCLDKIVQETERADLEYLKSDLAKAVNQSLEGVQHVSHIVKAMKDFSHPGTGEKVAVDLNRAVNNALAVARNELKYVADAKTELDPHLPHVPCLPGEINQVLLNLLVNATHAIGDVVARNPGQRGTILVSTHNRGDSVEIRVTDTGTGIPEGVRQRVFEPFFTTKGVSRGTGQGLSLAHATIVGRHNGRIWFETETGKGTTFFIRLPLVMPTDTAAAETPLSDASAA